MNYTYKCLREIIENERVVELEIKSYVSSKLQLPENIKQFKKVFVYDSNRHLVRAWRKLNE